MSLQHDCFCSSSNKAILSIFLGCKHLQLLIKNELFRLKKKLASEWPPNAMLHLPNWYIPTSYDFDRINPEP